ncbi:MAG: hypothetical protein MK188_09715 [Gammaproteobacteria bacterium]|nr:hypothetical protein [Gammaproteobacteria bacterium]
MKQSIFIAISLLAGMLANASAATIFTDTFQDGDIQGWTASSNGNGSAVINYYRGNYSLRVNYSKSASVQISTAGYTGVTVSLDLAAYSLEGSDSCRVESSSNNGASWTTLLTASNGQDNSQFLDYSGQPVGADNNSGLQIRVRALTNSRRDYCYLDNLLVQGSQGSGSPQISVSGNGDIGTVEIGSSMSTPFTISNTGTASLAIGSLSGLNAPFSFSDDDCSNQSLSPGGNCSVSVSFTPDAQSTYTDILLINSNDPAQPIFSQAVSGAGSAPSGCSYDCLTGNGNTNRDTVTYNNLTGALGNGSLVNFNGFALPAGASNPSNTFEGSLVFNGVQRGWQEVNDPFLYASLNGVKQLPDFNYQFVQHGTHLIPVQRGIIQNATTLGEWDLILEPGRVWDENSDNGYSRVALPFALLEYNQNCTHNGVLSFLFNDTGAISNVQYQIASETCEYFQFNMYGRLAASYNPGTISASVAIKSAYENEVANRITTKAISALATDYPGANINTTLIGSDQSSNDQTAYGVYYNNVHYVSNCNTRQGEYPFCDVMSLPSYSTAKSVVGGLSLMRLEQRYSGNQKDALINDYVSACSDTSLWSEVTIEDALDMATGNYDNVGYEVDEANYAVTWLYANTHAEKINISCNGYPRKTTPGTTWVYHTSDTYLVGQAVDSYTKNQEGDSFDFFSDMLVTDVYQPLNLSPSMRTTIRTRDSVNAAVAGLGLFYHRDDVVKLAKFLNNDNGMINGTQILDASMLDASMQKNAADRGLPIQPSVSPITGLYNNSFWAYDLNNSTVVPNCTSETWIPYMSGYGGIGIVMLPNGMSYYFFSDGLEYEFTQTLKELDKISAICN